MNCSEAKYVTPLYLSSELDVRLMAEYELHLEQCGACRREAEQARMYDDLLRETFADQPLFTNELRARIWNGISASESRRPIFFRWSYVLAVAAVLLLAIGAGITYVALLSSHSQTVYTSAVEDHTEEVVQHAPIDGWLKTPGEIDGLIRKNLGNININSLAPADYKLARARVCDLLSEQYVHLVYQGAGTEISIFVKREGNALPGPYIEVVNGCPLHTASTGTFQVAAFQSERFTVLIVSDLPPVENIRLARQSALRIA